MAINLQDSTASYGFQKQQQQAVHLRITREVKEALERAKTTGEATSLQLPGAGSGLVSSVHFCLTASVKIVNEMTRSAAGHQSWRPQI